MKAGTFLGHDIGGGVRPEFQKHLDTAKGKVDDEFKKSGDPIPAGYGIQNIGGYRKGFHPHGAGVAIDIDVRTNPYVMHEGAGDAKYARQGHLTPVDQEQVPVYGRIAEFMLNDPIDGEQSIIPELIRSAGPIPKGSEGHAARAPRPVLGPAEARERRDGDLLPADEGQAGPRGPSQGRLGQDPPEGHGPGRRRDHQADVGRLRNPRRRDPEGRGSGGAGRLGQGNSQSVPYKERAAGSGRRLHLDPEGGGGRARPGSRTLGGDRLRSRER